VCVCVCAVAFCFGTFIFDVLMCLKIALELTNCQLMKGRRQLYDAKKVHPDTDQVQILDDEQEPCLVGTGGANPYDASSCLPLMSDYALNLYHQILLNTQDVCARLTDERMLLQKEEAVQNLVYVSSAVSQQMQNMMEYQMESDRAQKAREETAALAMDQMAVKTASFLQEQMEKMMKTQEIDLGVAFQTRERETAMAC